MVKKFPLFLATILFKSTPTANDELLAVGVLYTGKYASPFANSLAVPPIMTRFSFTSQVKKPPLGDT